MSHTFSIPVVPPYPWEFMLRYLALRCTPRLDEIGSDYYQRRTPEGCVRVEFDPAGPALLCSLEGACDAERAKARIEQLFDVHRDPREVQQVLRRSPVLRPLLSRLPGLRVPGCWEPFELCVRVILGQQVSVKAAHTHMRRLVERCGGLQPAAVAQAAQDGLPLPSRRIQTLRIFAERVAAGELPLLGEPWSRTAERLRQIPGFGPWTLQYLALRLGRDADAFPEQDLGLLHAADARTPAQLRCLAESWRPYRGYAAMCLWWTGLSH